MTTLKLALRNLLGAGLRTWLNVVVLSLSFVVIIWYQGVLQGWNKQARRDTIAWEVGGGQFWHPAYDPYDPFTLEQAHGPLPAPLREGVERGELTPILVAQVSIYPSGRMQSALAKGIDPGQRILKIPSAVLLYEGPEIPAIVGRRMAQSCHLSVGDVFTVRWRDRHGTFDAQEAKIVQIMKTDVGTVDNGQLWIPLEHLRRMLDMPEEATLVVASPTSGVTEGALGWEFKSQEFLLQDIEAMIRAKSGGTAILYFVLMALALLAIFDTQVLSIWRRRKEIGTLIALGMTRGQVVALFTSEGAMHGVLAAVVAAAYGIPLLLYFAVKGLSLPREVSDSMGMAIAERIFPAYSAGLVVGTTVLVLLAVTIVSFLPARKIAKLRPTDALRGRTS
ncbi:MAG: FtsX-like permease family protein [candidate division KSB1 bacterium]|nr:FtsX-like permease family protein [candidate division KSB1 bacterium]MDZ7295043.1 FtsX-like permease family protein [candidate division KSB1 bacterium]MDZ7385706.1 FtsX-like permease family protein [candidate division KSB1 bacterium]MDZ7392980.1 FtsX-like permease family protein [candidate division KSB1 bacterium]MDZ7413307.1 FtsX-like permease family protein [candidate division KSB1 bacterium]